MDKFANTLAVLMLVVMFGLMLGSSWNYSAIFDEVAHIPAGYTSLMLKDGRLNPEHPPLLKNLAALPLIFLNLKGNITVQPFWTMENVNDRQWTTGNYLLYEAGNNADRILFWSRLPFMLLAILFGWLIFWWARKNFGDKAALLTLFFYATSPTFLAHSRFVTTDIGAALGFFLGIIFFLKFLERRDKKSLIYCGLIFGLVNLFKFSLFLLAPLYLILGFLWIWFKYSKITYEFAELIGQIFLIGLVGFAVIYFVYIWQVWNYPMDQQIKDVRYILSDYKYPSLAKLDFWLVEHSLTRPLGQYFYGFLMVARRTAGGNTAYFMGEVSSKGWWSYFPILTLVKEQLGLYLLALIAIFTSTKEKIWKQKNFYVIAAIVFIIFYWLSSILNPLNIGVRHVLPTFPFIYLLVALGIVNFKQHIFTALIMVWMLAEVIFTFPYYLSYYNELGRGLQNGYKIATDSNYDWGQDLRRLAKWREKNHIQKIYLDYFGGGSPHYYLGNGYEGWWSSFGPPPKDSYFAVSLNSLIGNQAKPIGDIKIKPEDAYSWLKNKTPIARGGSSIFIYKF